MSLEFVRADVLRNVHGRLIELYGGMVGVRDDKALGSAIGRPRYPEAYGGIKSVPHLAAALAWSLLRNHPFSDGNKRSAFAALLMLLELNGYTITCSEVEETAMVLRAVASEMSEDEWTAWVKRVAKPLKTGPLVNAI